MSKLTYRQLAKLIEDHPECLDQPFRLIIWNDDLYTLDEDATFATVSEEQGCDEDFPILINGEADQKVYGRDWAFHL